MTSSLSWMIARPSVRVSLEVKSPTARPISLVGERRRPDHRDAALLEDVRRPGRQLLAVRASGSAHSPTSPGCRRSRRSRSARYPSGRASTASETTELIPPRDGMKTRKKMASLGLAHQREQPVHIGRRRGGRRRLRGRLLLPGMFGENQISALAPSASGATRLRFAVLSVSLCLRPVALLSADRDRQRVRMQALPISEKAAATASSSIRMQLLLCPAMPVQVQLVEPVSTDFGCRRRRRGPRTCCARYGPSR